MKKFTFLALALSLSFFTYGMVKLPKLISDGMIIQRNKPIVIWGWADPNEKITVQFKNQTKKSKADNSGKWKVTLQPESAGGPFQLVVKGTNTLTVNDILIGEVWICSGQSNMEWPVSSANNAEEEIKQGNFPEIRQFLVKKEISVKPEEDVAGGDWKGATPENVGNFTAVGYFFARELYNQLKIPIGLINTSWGGTHSETWTSREAFEQSAEFKDMIATMPQIDLDKLNREKKEAQIKKLGAMGISLPAQGVAQWKEPDFNDSQWKPMTLPGLWEQQGLPDLDGVIWFRKSLNIDTRSAGKDATLELSMIDDSDETFINGQRVGLTKAKYNEKRKYSVPAGLLKSGANVIAVRVEDTGGGGGIYGDAQDMRLTLQGGEVIPLSGNWTFMIEEIGGSTSIGPNSYPTLLFNAMINPLLNAGIAGALWYQGESNAGRAYQYRTAFPLLIQDWRKHWKQGDFPFYYVQLASFNSDNGTSERGSTWAELREAQTMTLSLPHTGMAVTTDIGQANDIHPRNKQDVGKRLAAIALHNEYGQKVVYNGPVYQSLKVEGDNIRVSFTNTGTGLMVKDKYGYLKGFEIAGPDKKFYYAKASIEGNDVVVSAAQVHGPVAVRFAWADNPEDANLYNSEGFPASPFRTDDWKGITTEAKFSIE
ncbi:MAG TPA: sialate O-acetylesterase [Chryseolinea sp.]|nr:sialate O-acetylesterase [Chryseolinea sp.]